MPKIDETLEWDNLLKRLKDSDPTLTQLNLSGNEIGASGAKDLSLALQANRTLTQLNLSRNQIGASGAKDLSGALQANHTLTQLHLDYNRIGEQLDETLKLAIEHNREQQKRQIIQRRDQFIQTLITLARDGSKTGSQSLWSRLPKELMLHIISFIDFRSPESIKKSAQQIYQCAAFIFNHIPQFNAALAESLKTQQNFKLMEKTDSQGNRHFRFFPPPSQPALPAEETIERPNEIQKII